MFSFTKVESDDQINGIWVKEKVAGEQGNAYLIVRGEEIQLYLESYWTAGYNQYFGGEKLIANQSLFIHVDNYLTISPNTGSIVRYNNCPKFKLQRIKLHEVKQTSIQLEVIPGSSIYNSFGFFDEKILKFRKVTPAEFTEIDPIFNKIPEILMSNSTKVRDCSAIESK